MILVMIDLKLPLETSQGPHTSVLEILDPIVRILFRAVIGTENYQCVVGKELVCSNQSH
jgi:hypothetical protein